MNAPTNTAAPVGRIMLKNVRLAFAQGLFNPSTIPGSGADAKPKFNCGLILAADHPQLAEIKKVMQQVAKDKWKDKAVEVYKALEKGDKLALHDGDLKPTYDGYPGNYPGDGYPGSQYPGQYPGGSNGYPGDYPGNGRKQKQPKQNCFLIFCAPS